MVMFHSKLVKQYQQEMFRTLLHKHNLVNSTPKMIEYVDAHGQTISQTRGYYLVKDNTRYVLSMKDMNKQDNLKNLPIKVKTSEERDTRDKHVVEKITNSVSFKIIPERILSLKQIAELDGLYHDDADTINMIRIIAYTAYCTRINTILSGVSSSGKSSYFQSLGTLTDKGYVVPKPKSVLGIALGLSEDGFLCCDEMGAMTTEQKTSLQDFFYQAGELNDEFKTGKGKSHAHKLLSKYDINNLSVVLICNLFEDYLCTDTTTGSFDANKKTKFIHYAFDNSAAINRRFMPLRMNDPNLTLITKNRQHLPIFLPTDQFINAKNLKLNDKIRECYKQIIKSLEYYKVNFEALVDWEYIKNKVTNKVYGTHKDTYMKLLGGIYLWSLEEYTNRPNDIEFDKYHNILLEWNKNYYDALDKYAKNGDEE